MQQPREATAEEAALIGKFRHYLGVKINLAQACGVNVGIHGYDGYTCHYVSIKETELRGSCGEATEVVADRRSQNINWDSQLREFCELMGIPFTQPKWWLVVDYR